MPPLDRAGALPRHRRMSERCGDRSSMPARHCDPLINIAHFPIFIDEISVGGRRNLKKSYCRLLRPPLGRMPLSGFIHAQTLVPQGPAFSALPARWDRSASLCEVAGSMTCAR
jgi:hypothetical protein